MSKQLLQVKHLTVDVEQKEILHGIDLNINAGETHVLMGPNGAGKSTLGYTLMGNPKYHVTGGEILFQGKDITDEAADKRAKEGIFLSFQNPVEVPGITLASFIRSALEQRRGKRLRLSEFRKELNAAMDILQMDHSYADRDLNVGFSGGEKKKAEILQLLMLRPALAILDETDSGLDVDALGVVSRGIDAYKKATDGTLVIITHNTRILEHLHVDRVHVMVAGRIVKEGGADLIPWIDEHGFESFEQVAGHGAAADPQAVAASQGE